MAVRAPITYYGSKQRLAAVIASMLPVHSHYIEPCGGSLAVLLAKDQVRAETVNDLDGQLMTFWRVLRERPDELAYVCALTPHSRAEYAVASNVGESDCELEQARRVWVKLTQGRAGTLRSTGWRFNAADNSPWPVSRQLSGYVERMHPVVERLKSVTLECRDAVEVIETYGRARRSLIYLDPPYPAETRAGRSYRIEADDQATHERFAAAVHECAATVVVSGYACELYDEQLYPDWHRYELSTWTNQGSGKGERSEVLWSNRPLSAPDPLITDLATFRNNTPHLRMVRDETRCAEPSCAKAIDQPQTGRPRRYCSAACRMRAHRRTNTTSQRSRVTFNL